MPQPAPDSAAVQVGICPIPPDAGALWAGLPADEKAQAAAIGNPLRHRQYVCSRRLMRAQVAQYLGQPGESLALAYPPERPPALSGDSLRLGLSHSAGLCVSIVAADQLAGCDVERVRTRGRRMQIAAAYFHEREARQLGAGASGSDFYRLWTLKEAAHKARGRGIDAGLLRPAFELRPRLRCIAGPDSGRWAFATAIVESQGQPYALGIVMAGATPANNVQTWCYHFDGRGLQARRTSPRWQFASTGPAMDD